MVNSQYAHLDRTFAAMGDSTRLSILSRLQSGSFSVSELAAPLPITLPAVMKHLDVLNGAGLIAREKTGRTVMVSLRPEPLRKARLWLDRYERFWTPRLDRLAIYAKNVERQKKCHK